VFLVIVAVDTEENDIVNHHDVFYKLICCVSYLFVLAFITDFAIVAVGMEVGKKGGNDKHFKEDMGAVFQLTSSLS